MFLLLQTTDNAEFWTENIEIIYNEENNDVIIHAYVIHVHRVGLTQVNYGFKSSFRAVCVFCNTKLYFIIIIFSAFTEQDVGNTEEQSPVCFSELLFLFLTLFYKLLVWDVV